MTVFFTADTHFGHGGALGLYRRPFPSVAAMDAAIVQGWTRTVSADDEIWHLGDFALTRTPAAMQTIFAQLPGRKHLITGNNDNAATQTLGWTSIQAYAEITLASRLLVLCHYPFRTWRDMGRGAINLHGHSHGRLSPLPRQFDVGVDPRGFRPVTLDDIQVAARGLLRKNHARKEGQGAALDPLKGDP